MYILVILNEFAADTGARSHCFKQLQLQPNRPTSVSMTLPPPRPLFRTVLFIALGAFLPLHGLQAQVPVITSPSNALATVSGGNPSFSYTIAATNSPTAFTASPLPQGLALVGGNTISGSPTTPGVYTIALTASNGQGTSNGTLTLTVGIPQIFASNFNYPTTLKFDSSGNLYTPNQNSTTISEISPSGVVSTFASDLSSPDTLVFSASGTLYAGNLGNNVIDKVGPPPTNQLIPLGSGFNAPSGIAFDSAGNLYVANANAGTVSKVTPGGVVSNWVTGLSSPTDVIFDAAGNLYICDHGTNALYRVGPSGGSPTTLLTGLSNPLRLAVDAGGNVYVSLYGTGTIAMVTPSGAAVTFATLTQGVCGLAFDSAGNLYVSNILQNTITRIGAAPGAGPEIFRRTSQTNETWSAYSATFTPTQSGSYTLGFNIVSADPSIDSTIFLDNVSVTSGSTSLFQSGFEAPTVTDSVYPTYAAQPGNFIGTQTFGDWAFTDYSGVIAGNSAQWGGTGPEEGNQRGFLQAYFGGLSNIKTASPLSLVAGQTYTATFYQMARSGYSGGITYTVRFDRVAPPVVSSGSQSVRYDLPFTYQIQATNSPTSYGASSLPAGLALNAATGVISGTLPAAVATYTIGLSATNAGGPATGTLTLSVIDKVPPVISSLTVAPVKVKGDDGDDWINLAVTAKVADAIDPSPVTKITAVTYVDTLKPKKPGDKDDDKDGDKKKSSAPFAITGNLTLKISRELPAGTTSRTYTITVTSTDKSGNASTGTVTSTQVKDSDSDNHHDNSSDDSRKDG